MKRCTASDTNSSAADGDLPLLVLRLPQLEKIAWRQGKRAARDIEAGASRAFRTAAARVLRRADRRRHVRGSDVFTVLLSKRPRTAAQAPDCRAILQRLASAMSAETGLEVESGWVAVPRCAATPASSETIAEALERGARQNERYQFFSAVGHELRTPLASIRGYLETLIEESVDRQTARRFLQTAQREALRLGRMLDGMYDFSLLDLTAAPARAGWCDLGEQSVAACEVIAPLCRERNITLLHDIAQECAVAIDPDAALQLVVNLLENAMKYGKQHGEIALNVVKRDGAALIAVDDDGPGIAAAERSAIFSLHVRACKDPSVRGGGIGLALVRLIAERAGGGAHATDSVMGGARFEVTLPLKAEIRMPPS